VLENKSLKELNVESHTKEIHDLRECNKQLRVDLEKFTKGKKMLDMLLGSQIESLEKYGLGYMNEKKTLRVILCMF